MLSTTVGYAGGNTPNPTYDEICTNDTGHAETVLVEFDPEKISYGKLLDKFFSIHNPCVEHHRKGRLGSQYRSAIFYLTDNQKAVADTAVKGLSKAKSQAVLTEVSPLGTFTRAEEYHQQFEESGGGGACRLDR